MSLVAELERWRARLASLDADLLPVDLCAAVLAGLAGLGKACDAAMARVAARVETCGAQARDGFVNAAEWLAVACGSSAVEARRALDSVSSVAAGSETDRAWREGGLSVGQVAEIAKTAKVEPGSEGELLALARSSPLRVLRETARQRRLRSVDAEELAARQRKARHFRHWTDDVGMTRVSGAFCPADGAAFLSRLDAETERLRRAARRAGHEEPWEAHAADALVALGVGAARAGRGGRKADVVMVCNVNAFRRGHAHEDEACHVVDGGPIPVGEVRAVLDGDAFLKVALHDGVQILTVKHYGRHLPAELRTAL